MALPGQNTIVQKTDNAVENVKKPALLFTVGLTYITYIFIFLGVSYISPQYIRVLSNIMHILIAGILIYKFNPFRSVTKFTEGDANLIFFIAVFLVMSTGITEIALTFFKSLKTVFNPPNTQTI